jgi:hypothetical protein
VKAAKRDICRNRPFVEDAKKKVRVRLKHQAMTEQAECPCHLNNAYLCRLFRRYDNPSPYQYLLRLQVNFAAERLQQPGAMVKQVRKKQLLPTRSISPARFGPC